MKIIDIYGENRFEQYTKLREACRGIVIKNDKILLTYEVNTDQWLVLCQDLVQNKMRGSAS